LTYIKLSFNGNKSMLLDKKKPFLNWNDQNLLRK
jgi:hypothetical protein